MAFVFAASAGAEEELGLALDAAQRMVRERGPAGQASPWGYKPAARAKTLFGEVKEKTEATAVSGGGRYFVTKLAGKAVLREGTTGKELGRAQISSTYFLRFTPGDRYLVAGAIDGTILLLDVPSLSVKRTFEGYGGPGSIAFSPDGRYLFAAVDDPGMPSVLATMPGAPHYGTVIMSELETGAEVRRFDQTGNGSSLAVSPDGGRLMTLSYSGEARLWNAATGELLKTAPSQCKGWGPASFLGKRVVVLSRDQWVCALDAETLMPAALEGAPARARDFAAAQGRWAFVDEAGKLGLAAVGTAPRNVEWLDSVKSAAFSSDGSWLAAVSRDGSLVVLPAE